jgi:hypothetical protein
MPRSPPRRVYAARRMRALVATTLLVLAATAHADGNLELAGGISIPAGDNNWENIAHTSPKLGVRIGDFFKGGDFGVNLQFDWTPINLNNSGSSFGVGDAAANAHVFRILIDPSFQHHVTEHIVLSGRVGIGMDIAHASGSVSVLGFTGSRSDTDVGLAVEFGAGVWYDFGEAQVGGEIAVPIGNHSSPSENGSIPFQYAMYDIDLLAGVRLRGF